MKIKKIRTAAVIAGAAVTLLLLATSPLWTAILVKRQAFLIVNDSLHSLTASSLANINVSDGFLEMTIALSTNDPVVRDANLEKIVELTNQTSTILSNYARMTTNQEERSNYEWLIQQRSIFNKTRQKTIDLLVQGKREDAVQLFSQVALKEFQEYKEAVNRVVRANVNEAGSRGKQILRLCNNLMIFQGVLLVFFCIYAFLAPMLTVLDKIVTKDVVKDI
jgi:hypothetical protein